MLIGLRLRHLSWPAAKVVYGSSIVLHAVVAHCVGANIILQGY